MKFAFLGYSLEQKWDAMSKSMAAAPDPELVATEIRDLIESNHAPPSRVLGNFEQSILAPLAARILPTRWMERLLRNHYR